MRKISWGKNKIKLKKITRRDFLEGSLKVAAGAAFLKMKIRDNVGENAKKKMGPGPII